VSLGERDHLVHLRPHAGGREHREQARQLVAGAHRRADHPQLQEEQPVEVRGGVGAGGGAGDDEGAARAQALHGVAPGRLAHGLEDRVDPGGQAGARLEDLVRAELERACPPGLVAAGDPDR
jgi:hypothetical protein